jgi:hypothetical protein
MPRIFVLRSIRTSGCGALPGAVDAGGQEICSKQLRMWSGMNRVRDA